MIRILLLLLSALGATPAFAVPMAYNYDSAGATLSPDFEGAGMFTLDLGTAFGLFAATDVMGGPGDSLGDWARITVEIAAGFVEVTIIDAGGRGVGRGTTPGAYGLTAFADASSAWSRVIADPRGSLVGVAISLKQAAVPEPNIIALLSLGLAGLGFTRRRIKAA